MRILHISDTHTFHAQLTISKDIDIIIFSGDCSNPRDLIINEHQVKDFITWFGSLNIRYKIMIAGNHDTSIEHGYVNKLDIQSKGIIYLENDFTEIEGIKIWGSPHTPTFGQGWAFNKARHKLHDLWATIPDDTDIIVVHGPPQGCLDISYDRYGKLEFCGCSALKKRVLTLQPKLVLFGHIHNMEGVNNAGTLKLSDSDTIYSNGSVVYDGRFDKGITSNGNIFEINGK